MGKIGLDALEAPLGGIHNYPLKINYRRNIFPALYLPTVSVLLKTYLQRLKQGEVLNYDQDVYFYIRYQAKF